MGLLTWSSAIDGDISNAESVIPGAVLESEGYKVRSQPIPAKNMGDSLYFKVYAKLADGTYVYSIQRYYSAKLYADIMLADKNASANIKSLCVALMNYGAAAQSFFDYNTDALMNADLTAEQQALEVSYSADLLPDIVMPGDKAGALADNGSMSSKGASVNFGGAFAINYSFVTAYTPRQRCETVYLGQRNLRGRGCPDSGECLSGHRHDLCRR